MKGGGGWLLLRCCAAAARCVLVSQRVLPCIVLHCKPFVLAGAHPSHRPAPSRSPDAVILFLNRPLRPSFGDLGLPPRPAAPAFAPAPALAPAPAPAPAFVAVVYCSHRPRHSRVRMHDRSVCKYIMIFFLVEFMQRARSCVAIPTLHACVCALTVVIVCPSVYSVLLRMC